MDLDISGVSDEDEEDPGEYICVNNDDDNNNSTPDNEDTGTVSGEDDLVEISLSYEPSSLYPGYVELQIPYSDNDIKVWSSSEKGTLVVPNGNDYYKRWSLGSQPSTLWVEGYSSGTADLWLLYSNSTDPDDPVYPGGDKNHDPVKFTIPYMKLEKVGNTTIEAANNYSENTTIRVTAVNANGQTYESFTGTVNIAEDTSGQGYVEIYSQNGGYLPNSVNITSGGTTTFIAKSLAGPKSSTSKPDPAKIITTNHDVYGPVNYLSVAQWTNDLGQVHNKSSGIVYDWFETRTKDIFDSASGDLATVLSKMSSYEMCTHDHGGQAYLNHTATSPVCFNPHNLLMRLDSESAGFCGYDRTKAHTNAVIHEARHCYQDYLSSQDLGQTDDIAGKPNNDDDEDWLFETVPIGPSNYILDTGTSRSTCAGNKSFSGDATADSWEGNVQEAIEKDAAEYAE